MRDGQGTTYLKVDGTGPIKRSFFHMNSLFKIPIKTMKWASLLPLYREETKAQ